ncbi:hypothetical protein QO010_003956 [Caulobacter ginsengisoli]|uniref:DUF4282 domain-containing protein n=2 Tax=Caulobacter ginsengisoli TaxID=400775 RepID=A0ABU0IVX8_9CAUL|nr:hypothetical protein [Caulobacter ginsengisoli]
MWPPDEVRMAPARPVKKSRGVGESILWDLLTFERLLTGPVIHLIYWAGLGVVLIGGFGAFGVAVGVAWREESIMGKLLAFPAGVVGLLITAVLALLWRSFCEFYVAIFRIADDLRALRQASDADHALKP